MSDDVKLDEQKRLNDYSSKIKRIFIELHDYKYYHGPSGSVSPDRRFIGRERLIMKLKSVLSDMSKLSGCYLVTGYRGMGKTSYVNKVLESIYTPSLVLRRIVRWAVFLFFSFILLNCLVNKDTLLWAVVFISIAIALVCIIIYKLWGLYKASGDKVTSRKEIIANYYSTFISENYIYDNLRKSSYYYFNVVCLCFINGITLLIISIPAIKDKVFAITIALTCWLLGIIVLAIIQHFRNIAKIKAQKNSELSINNQIQKFSFFEAIKNFVDNSSRINIKLNLGYSNLKEIDILRLIARNIKNSYDKYLLRFTFSFLLRISLLLTIYFIAKGLYEAKTINGLRSGLRHNIGLTNFFPSQGQLYLNDTSLYLCNIIDKLKQTEGYSIEDYQLCSSILDGVYLDKKTGSNFDDTLNTVIYGYKYLFTFLGETKFDNTNINEAINHFNRKKEIYVKFRSKIFDYCIDSFNDSTQITDNQLPKQIFDTITPATLKSLIDSSNSGNLSVVEINNLILYFKTNACNALLVSDKDINFSQFLLYQHINNLKAENKSYSSFKASVAAFTSYSDYLIYCSYHFIRKTFFFSSNFLLPPSIDYLFIIYMLTIYLAFVLVNPSIISNQQSLRKLRKKIKFLNDLIDTHLIVEVSGGVGLSKTTNIFSKRKNKDYPRADEREIEKYLIEIIEDIGKRNIFSYRAQFVFVFDELDKIEPNRSFSTSDSENPSVSASEHARKRQQTIMELLSNLKYFLSTAQAKFVFIAGREMFDASLADISDRNFRLGSIFHDIFYLNSFFTDLNRFGFDDITSRTEEYVCQFLFPVSYRQKTNPKPNNRLKDYNKYLKTLPDFKETPGQDDKNKVARQKREKIIHFLQQYIIYLNHVSKGAPSKLTSFFENNVITKGSVSDIHSDSIIAGENKFHNLFLFFDFYSQYKIGMINYLFTPINFSINKNIRNFSDKLIVSASFLHDHLLKFHRNAFTWRDLEATPEMLDVNKNPELRNFLSSVIQFMLDAHIQPVSNGLYEFKYPKRISQEIAYLSHISEEASASFNFTLDESLEIKKHFEDQLTKHVQLHKTEKNNTDNNNYVFSFSSLYLTLADLSFFDEDLGDAILFYLEAIQPIRALTYPAISLTQLALLARNMLKLGHALEKRHTYDVAFLTFNEITDKIKGVIDIVKYQENNKREILSYFLKNVRILNQPNLARLYLIEKNGFEGITSDDIKKADNQFYELISLFPEEDKNNFRSEYNNKIGDLLYYRNAVDFSNITCPFKSKTSITKKIPSACESCHRYKKAINSILSNFKYADTSATANLMDQTKEINQLIALKEELLENKIIHSDSTILLLASLISDLGDVYLSCREIGELKNIESITNETFKDAEKIQGIEISFWYFSFAGFLYRKAGDHKGLSYQNIKMLYLLREIISIGKILSKETIDSILKPINLKANSGIYCAYEHIHTYEINRFKRIFKENDYPHDISLNRISLNSEIDEITVLSKEIDLLLSDKADNGGTINSEIIPIYWMVNSYNLNDNMYNRFLKLRLKALAHEKAFNELFGYNLLATNTNYSDIYQLYFNFFKIPFSKSNNIAKFDFYLTDSIFCYWEILKILNTFDSSFSLNHSLLAEIHEKLYVLSSHFNAYMLFQTSLNDDSNYEKYLTDYFITIPDNYKNELASLKKMFVDERLENEPGALVKLKRLIEPDNIPFITPVYHAEKAIREYYSAIETHTCGKAYKALIANMYYLNDDFNDKSFHFSIALERFKILQSNLKVRIEGELKEKMKSSSIYDYRNYYDTKI